MTNELVGRFDPPTAQRIAPATELAIGSPPVLMEILPAIGNRFCGFVGLRLHTFKPPKTELTLPRYSRVMVASTHSKACTDAP